MRVQPWARPITDHDRFTFNPRLSSLHSRLPTLINLPIDPPPLCADQIQFLKQSNFPRWLAYSCNYELAARLKHCLRGLACYLICVATQTSCFALLNLASLYTPFVAGNTWGYSREHELENKCVKWRLWENLLRKWQQRVVQGPRVGINYF